VTAVLSALTGATVALFAVSWTRLVARELGLTAGLDALTSAAIVGGLSVGVLVGRALTRAAVSPPMRAFALLQGGAALWGIALATLFPRTLPAAVEASPALLVLVVAGATALPMFLSGMALAQLSAGPPSATDDGSSVIAVGGASLLGAAVTGVLVVDVAFAFTGVRGIAWTAVAVQLVVAGVAAVRARRRTTDVAERA
jgi:hypothetical protein